MRRGAVVKIHDTCLQQGVCVRAIHINQTMLTNAIRYTARVQKSANFRTNYSLGTDSVVA